MRIRFYPSRKRRRRIPARQKWALAGSVCLLLLCLGGLTRYAVNAMRSARISRTFQELYASSEAEAAQRSPILRQFEVTFSKATGAGESAAPTAPPQVSSWPGNPGMAVSPALQKLRQRNRDIIGWLSIPDQLAQAVVQRDNTYYLKRDYLGYHNANGALFLEESISLKTRPDTYIIFGHNMKTGDMFGSLRLYENIGYYRKHALIDFNALYEEGQYVVFAIADVDTVQGMRRYVPFMQLPGMEEQARRECIQKLQAYSVIYSPVSVSAKDQLLLLVTCEGTEESRRVVAARRLRDGETAAALYATLENAQKRK